MIPYSWLELKWYEMRFLSVAIYLYLSPKIQRHQERYQEQGLWISVCGPSMSKSEMNPTVWTFFPEGQRYGRPSDWLRSVYLSNPQERHHIPLSLRGSNQPFRCAGITINPDYFGNELYWMLWFGGMCGGWKSTLCLSVGALLCYCRLTAAYNDGLQIHTVLQLHSR